MSGAAADLAQALASMRFRVLPGRFALVGVPRAGARPLLDAAGPVLLRTPFAQVIVEDETVTVLAPEELAEPLAREPGARAERGYRVVRFEAPMSWDVVGFLALATRALAEAGIPIGAVCGFDRDSLFLREEHVARARAALRERVCAEAER